jgi:hypothetical protein
MRRMQNDIADQETPLTAVAHGIPDGELARAVARQRLTSRLTDHAVAPLADCVQIGRAVGLTMSEMQRVTGLARQTLYRHLPAEDSPPRRPPRPQASGEVLMLLAAEGGFAAPPVLARRAGLEPTLVQVVATDLAQEGLCDLRRDGYSTSLEAGANSATYWALRTQFDDLYLRRPDAISVYVRVPADRTLDFERAADTVMAQHEHLVIPQASAPSVMAGPELAFPVNAPTIRRALAITRELWRDVLRALDLEFSEPSIANVIAPGSQPLIRSEVLDSFLESAVHSGAPNGDGMREVRDRFAGGISEMGLAGRCVTGAARALRRARGNESEPRPIVDGDAAFAELQPAFGVPVDPEIQPIKDAVVAALELATDRLGPMPGGRLGSFRAPGQRPAIVDAVTPAVDDLREMARLSGQAMGLAAGLRAVDLIAEMARLVIPAETVDAS